MSDSLGIDDRCFCTRDGLFKSIMFVLSVFLLILCGATQYWMKTNPLTQELHIVVFASGYSCFTLLFVGFLYFFKCYNCKCCTCLPWRIMEMCNCAICLFIHLISVSCAAAAAIKWQNYVGDMHGICVGMTVVGMALAAMYLVHGMVICCTGTTRMAPNMDPITVHV